MSKELFFNWKMNPTTATEGQNLLFYLAKATCNTPKARIVICPPTIYLQDFCSQKQKHNWVFKIGSQDVSGQESGPLTGEISARMLASTGIEYALIGHSETRELHSLSNHNINQKVQQTVANGLTPVVCIGFQKDKTAVDINYEELSEQIRLGLDNLPSSSSDIYLAYEPVWAIGTGKAADNATIETVTDFLRTELTKLGLSKRTKILYGGSVDDTNLKNLISINTIEGFLVGGASLDPKKFNAMIQIVK